MPNPKPSPTVTNDWREPMLIAAIALAKAEQRDIQVPNAGLLYMLAEILVALHRQADATEYANQLLEAIPLQEPTDTPIN